MKQIYSKRFLLSLFFVLAGISQTVADDAKFIIKGNTSKTYTDLNEADKACPNGGVIVLTNNGTLKSGYYTISSNHTLLIPYNTNYDVPTDKPTTTGTWTTPSAFRKLTFSEGTNVTVNGAICVAGQQFAVTNKMTTSQGGPSTPVGPLGQIDMKNGGKIILASGSKLYAYGYITGQNQQEGNNTTGVGQIEAQSGSNVYECMVIGDYQGGRTTSAMANETNKNNYKVFPFNQYFIPNIEVPLTLVNGATEYTVLNMTTTKGIDPDAIAVKLIANSGSLFTLDASNSKIKKWYDATDDRLHFETWDKVSIGSIELNVANVKVTSSDYVLPLTGSMSFLCHDGTLSVPNDVALLPGSQISLDEDATCTFSSNVYVWDADNWNKYGYGYNRIYFPFRLISPTYSQKWDGKTRLEDAKVEVNGTLNAKGHLFTTNGGANICSGAYGKIVLNTSPIATSNTYVLSGNGTEKTNFEIQKEVSIFGNVLFKACYATQISVTAAQLHNADGSYVKTSGAAANTTYYYYDGTWNTSRFTYNQGNHVLRLGYKGEVSAADVSKSVKNKDIVTGNILSADLTKATGTFDVAAMRTAIGATDDNNVLLYAPSNANVGVAKNVIVDNKAANLVITDKQPIDVPTAFTAANVTYNRTSNSKWGTVCVPYELNTGNGIQYYKLDKIDGTTMYFTKMTSVEANQPAIYSVEADGSTIKFGGGSVAVKATSTNDVKAGSYTLVGVQTKAETLNVGDNCFYIAQNKFWQPTKNAVTVSPQRAYFKASGAAALAKVLNIGVSDGEATGISTAESTEPTVVGIFTLGGAKLNTLEKGVNIVKMSDGTTRKVIVR